MGIVIRALKVDIRPLRVNFRPLGLDFGLKKCILGPSDLGFLEREYISNFEYFDV